MSGMARGQQKKKSGNDKPVYRNATLTVEERLNDLMQQMTLEEKVAQMCQYVGLEHMKQAEKNITEDELKKSDAQGFYPGLLSNDVAKMTTEGKIGSFLHVVTEEEANHLQQLAQQSRLKIPLLIGIDAIHGNGFYRGATVYPSPITQAATWDDELLQQSSAETALEMRATGSHWAFTPNIDVLRDPRWGRTGETFGEDPYLVGNMGIATIKGLQSDDFTGTSHVLACAKHLIGGGESINGLNASPLDVSERTLFEVLLPPYKRAIRQADVYTIMLAHNEVNGVPSHMNKYLMTDILRDKWGFKGFYVSDWNDVVRINTWHHVAHNFKEAAYLAVDAGMDMHMHGPEFADYIIQLVNEGKLPEERVDDACRKILEAKFRLGLFENPFVNLDKRNDYVFTREHQSTALRQAREGIVLLKNNGMLPLQKSIGKKIFITGPNANNQTTLGDWASPQPEENVVTVYEGINALATKYGYQAEYYNCGERSKWITDENITEAVNRASDADISILVLGENSFRHDWANKTTGENIDRATLALSGNQLKLATAIQKTGKPFVVIYVSGSPIAEPWLDSKASAVLNAFEPGAFGGQAIAEILFGEVNPSGKLPLTIPRSVGQLQMVYNHKPTAYIHKYNTEKKVPIYPFGYGLSFSNFELSEPRLSKDSFDGADDIITVYVDVTNTGSLEGDEIVQLYIRDNVSSVTRPVKELKDYERVTVKPGETKTVQLKITSTSLAFYDINYNYVIEPGVFTIMTGSSSADKELKKTTLKVNNKILLKD